MDDLTHTQKRILYLLNRCEKWRWWAGGNSWYSFKELSADINRPLKSTKRAVYDMKSKGIVYHNWLIGNNMRLAGSGYLLNPEWDNL